MLQHRELPAQALELDHIDFRMSDSSTVSTFGKHVTPGTDHDRVSVGSAPARMLTGLTAGNDEYHRLDGSRLQ